MTAGCNHDVAGFNGFQNIVDVFGFNYKPQLYGKFRDTNSAIPLYASETSSCVSSRGEYFFPVAEERSRRGSRIFSELLRPLRTSLGHAARCGVSRAGSISVHGG